MPLVLREGFIIKGFGGALSARSVRCKKAALSLLK
jgi:hypothetical protein